MWNCNTIQEKKRKEEEDRRDHNSGRWCCEMYPPLQYNIKNMAKWPFSTTDREEEGLQRERESLRCERGEREIIAFIDLWVFCAAAVGLAD